VPVDSHLSLVQNSYMLAFLDMSRPDSAKDAAARQVDNKLVFLQKFLGISEPSGPHKEHVMRVN
jgi:hypothetical protein